MKTRFVVLGLVAAVGIIAVVALSYTLYPAPTSSASNSSPGSSAAANASPTVYIVMGQSSCTAIQNNFSCTLVLSRSVGQISTSDISSVKINETAAKISGMSATEDSVSLSAGISIVSVQRGLNDVNITPVTVADVVVYLKDGTTVSALVPSQRAE